MIWRYTDSRLGNTTLGDVCRVPTIMNIEIALKKAIEYEKEVQELYQELSKKSVSPVARRFYEMLAEDEGRHVEFFHRKLREWLSTGKVTYQNLASPFSAQKSVAKDIRELASVAFDESAAKLSTEVKMLVKGLQLEERTTAFYREVMERLEGDQQRLFSKFVELETAHENVIKKQMKFFMENGTWLPVGK